MKRFTIAIVFVATALSAQTYTDCPNLAVRDVLPTAATMWVARDFYPNGENSFVTGRHFQGKIDLMAKAVSKTGSHTGILEVYGIIRRVDVDHYATGYSTTYVDSHRVASFTVVDDWKQYPLDPLWTYFPMYDGLRVTYKKTAGETDADTVYWNLRTGN